LALGAGFVPLVRESDGESFGYWGCWGVVLRGGAFAGTPADTILILVAEGAKWALVLVPAGWLIHQCLLFAAAMRSREFRRNEAARMARRWAIAGGALILLGVVFFLVRSREQRPHFAQEFDIGGGRTLRVWSERRGGGSVENSPLLYYRVDAGGTAIIPATFLRTGAEGGEEFRMASAEGGRLVCVYEVRRARERGLLFLIYDAAQQESWPHCWERGNYLDIVATWRERYRKLKAENPGLPTPPGFE
jgi:hypothetical protein